MHPCRAAAAAKMFMCFGELLSTPACANHNTESCHITDTLSLTLLDIAKVTDRPVY